MCVCVLGYATPGQTPVRDQLSINPDGTVAEYRSVIRMSINLHGTQYHVIEHTYIHTLSLYCSCIYMYMCIYTIMHMYMQAF